jgi:hypothetical protein
MKTSLKIIVATSTFALLGCATIANAANFVQNGSFENSSLPGPQYIYFGDPSQYNDITNWTIGSNGPNTFVSYFNNSNATGATGPGPYLPLPTSYNDVSTVPGDVLAPGASQTDADGGYFVALDGDNSGTQVYMQQTINGLTTGDKYDLSFLWGGIQLGGGYSSPTTESLQVSLGAETHSTAVVSECSQCFSGWFSEQIQFTATGPSEVLQFLSVGNGVPPMALIDGVSLTGAGAGGVPEPATWAMMLLGVVGLGAVAHRRRARVAALAV